VQGQLSATGLNLQYLRAVPAEALSILVVGEDVGDLCLALKDAGPDGRRVIGVGPDRIADTALQADSVDCLIIDGVLERVQDPLALIQYLHPALSEGGLLLCSVSNAQNFAFISALFTNDFQYRDSGLQDGRNLRLFTMSTIFKLLLDGDFLPQLIHTSLTPCDPDLWQAMIPLANYFRIDPDQIHVNLSVYHYVLAARPMPMVPKLDEPISFVACSNDPDQLANNLAASPCFRSGGHELIVVTDATSAAEGINRGVERASHRLVVAAHQDVYIPESWPTRFLQQWAQAERQFGPIGAAGVFGVSPQGGVIQRTGRAINGSQLISSGPALPAEASSLDEIILALPKDTPLRLDPVVGWHNYGTDLVLQARRAGLVSVILDAPCLHNTRFAGLRRDFVDSAVELGRKWQQERPFHTTCVRIDEVGNLSGW